jgi:hypothetical protein
MARIPVNRSYQMAALLAVAKANRQSLWDYERSSLSTRVLALESGDGRDLDEDKFLVR